MKEKETEVTVKIGKERYRNSISAYFERDRIYDFSKIDEADVICDILTIKAKLYRGICRNHVNGPYVNFLAGICTKNEHSFSRENVAASFCLFRNGLKFYTLYFN